MTIIFVRKVGIAKSRCVNLYSILSRQIYGAELKCEMKLVGS